MKWKRLIIDGNNLAHAHKHVYSHLSNKRRVPTGVVYGFMNMLHRVNEMFSPDEIYVAWDCEGPSARSIVYPDYKSARRNKETTKEEQDQARLFFDVQLPALKSLLSGLGIPQIQHKLLEADDVIALSVSKPTDTSEWVIVSNDKDYVQWVRRDKCRLYTPSTDYLFYQEDDWSVQGGKTEFGTVLPSPETYAIWRAIIGDKSDSLIGVANVGVSTVYDVFRDSLPAFDADDEMRVVKYLRSGHYASARSKILEEAAVKKCPTRTAIMDTLSIMRPTVPNIEQLLDETKKIAGVSSKKTRTFVTQTINARNDTNTKHIPLYLRNIKKDPNPFVMLLRRMNFEMGYYRNSWYPALRSFSQLYERRKEWTKHTPWSPCPSNS